MKTITSAQLIIILSVICCRARKYEGFTVYDIFPTKEQEPLLRSWLVLSGIDVLTARTGERVTVMVDPSVKSSLLDYLRKNKIRYNVHTENVPSFRKVGVNKSSSDTLPQDIFREYLTHLQMNKYMHLLAEKYPDLVQVQPYGISYEGRELFIIKISTEKSNKKKPIILIDAGIHAREWIAPAMALFIINQLVENKHNRYLIEDIDWHISPLLNPDGYEFSLTEYNWWRKTMSLDEETRCWGVDGNRNFDFHWMGCGASERPCANNFAGRKPFSENETRALRDYVLSIKSHLKLYLTFHSTGSMILYPWGYTSKLPPNAKELQSVAEMANEAQLRAGGPNYTIGTSENVLYCASGGSDDWVMGVANVSLAYTVELPRCSYSIYFPPPDEIRNFVTPFFEAVRIFGHHVAVKHYEDSGSKGKEQSASSADSERNLLKNRNYVHTGWLLVIEFMLQCNLCE